MHRRMHSVMHSKICQAHGKQEIVPIRKDAAESVSRLGGAHNRRPYRDRRIEYIGVTFRTRSLEQVRSLNSRMMADLGQMLSEGGPKVPIARRFAFDQASEALDILRRHCQVKSRSGRMMP